METTIIVPPEYIPVLKLFAADDAGTRSQIRGICVEIGPAESRLVATNGAILGVFRVFRAAPELPKPLSVILPNHLVDNIKGKGDVGISVGDVVEGINGRTVRLSQRGGVFAGVSIDGVYPDWRRVITLGAATGEAAMYDFKLLALLAKAYALLHGSKGNCLAAVAQSGQRNSALIDLRDDNFTGVIMPLTEKAVPKPAPVPPAWFADMLRTENVADLV